MTRKKKPTASLVRSSAAEYLTFVAASGKGGVEAVYADENVWLSQKMMAQLYDIDVRTINYHLKTIFADSELQEESVIRNFRITAADGKTYDTKHYNLSATIAVGYKVNSERAVQFRKWATRVVEEFTVKGFAMDDERLKLAAGATRQHAGGPKRPSGAQRRAGKKSRAGAVKGAKGTKVKLALITVRSASGVEQSCDGSQRWLPYATPRETCGGARRSTQLARAGARTHHCAHRPETLSFEDCEPRAPRSLSRMKSQSDLPTRREKVFRNLPPLEGQDHERAQHPSPSRQALRQRGGRWERRAVRLFSGHQRARLVRAFRDVELECLQNVLLLQIRIGVENFLDRHFSFHHRNNHRHGDPEAANAGLASKLLRTNCNSLKDHLIAPPRSRRRFECCSVYCAREEVPTRGSRPGRDRKGFRARGLRDGTRKGQNRRRDGRWRSSVAVRSDAGTWLSLRKGAVMTQLLNGRQVGSNHAHGWGVGVWEGDCGRPDGRALLKKYPMARTPFSYSFLSTSLVGSPAEAR